MKDDDDTVTSSTSDKEVQHAADAVTKTRKNRFFMGVIGGIVVVVLALIMGLAFGLTKANQDPTSITGPVFQEEEPSTSEYHEYQLSESLAPVEAADLFYKGIWDEAGFIDEDGCVNVIHYENYDVYEPLCKDFNNDISSFQLKETDVIIAHGGLVETWTSIWNTDVKAHTWEPLPRSTTGDILNVISEPGVPGFGKKVYDIGMYLIIASDQGVFSYSKPRSPDMPWIQNHHWESAIGFDVDLEETTLAVYDSSNITIYDLSADWWGDSYEPTLHTFFRPITTLAVSMHGNRVYVICDFGFKSFAIRDIFTDEMRFLDAPFKILGDVVYSTKSGSLFDIRSGTYLDIEVEDADDVFGIQVDGIHIAVLLERDGVKTVDFYEM